MMDPGVIRNNEGKKREERAASMIAEQADDVSPESEEHGLLKITSGICRLKKR